MNRIVSGIVWVTLYLVIIMVPLFLMLIPPVPTGRSFLLEFSVALGFVGLTQIAVQFILISRFKAFSAPYGIDIILHFHRQIALVAIGLILLHPILIIVDTPSRIKLLNPLGGNWASKSAWISTFCLVGLAVTSLFRKELRLNYEWWRLIHIILGVGAVVFAQIHVTMAGLYTNTLWKHAVWAVPAVFLVALILFMRVLRPALFPGNTWKVAEVRPEEGDCVTLVLEPDGHAGMSFLPGQFAWITLGERRFTMQENPFSMMSSANRPQRLEFGIKEVGDFTGSLRDVAPGTRARIDGPHGAFSIDRYPAVGYVFIAGGIGITPMLSFLNTMADRRDPRPIALFYADKSLDAMPYQEELEKLGDQLDLELTLVPENPPEDWEGESGMIDWDMLERHVPKELIQRELFICGPPPMISALHGTLKEMGVHEEHIHLELFDLV
ncbi:MAG: ferric reductase-like transmembrane domain-containing protein [Candidatus Sumerlaeia bacterium]|nr:ferric reductase-like transmembrane domain-containing protein [Candidatus Sumerlaeia bacterium]